MVHWWHPRATPLSVGLLTQKALCLTKHPLVLPYQYMVYNYSCIRCDFLIRWSVT